MQWCLSETICINEVLSDHSPLLQSRKCCTGSFHCDRWERAGGTVCRTRAELWRIPSSHPAASHSVVLLPVSVQPARGWRKTCSSRLSVSSVHIPPTRCQVGSMFLPNSEFFKLGAPPRGFRLAGGKICGIILNLLHVTPLAFLTGMW